MARGIEELIAEGHPNPLSYSPRQIMAFLALANQRSKREAHRDLSLQSLASQGQPKHIKEQLRKLEKEGG